MKRYGGLLLALSLMVLPVEAGEITQAELQSAVEAVRKSHDLVGFGAAIAYGDEGMEECKNILVSSGFDPLESHSTRRIWTCTR